MGRNCHDGSCSITDEYIVCDPDRNLLSVYRIDGIASGEYTCFVLCQIGPLKITLMLCFIDIFLYSFLLLCSSKFFYEAVLWSDYHVCRAEEGITTSGIYFKVFVHPINLEKYRCSFTATNPVSLHRFYGLWPVKGIEIFKKTIRICGDFQNPLPDVLLLNLCSATFTSAFLDLFVCESGLTAWTPVDRCGGFICKSFLIEFLKNPLCPVIVLLITCGYLPVPIVRETKAFKLTTEVLYVLFCRCIRMCSCLNRIILRRKSKSVKSHRMENIITIHRQIS